MIGELCYGTAAEVVKSMSMVNRQKSCSFIQAMSRQSSIATGSLIVTLLVVSMNAGDWQYGDQPGPSPNSFKISSD